MNELKPCPACGAMATQCNWYVLCDNRKCNMRGPSDDPRGEKWNALPRREPTQEPFKYCEDGWPVIESGWRIRTTDGSEFVEVRNSQGKWFSTENGTIGENAGGSSEAIERLWWRDAVKQFSPDGRTWFPYTQKAVTQPAPQPQSEPERVWVDVRNDGKPVSVRLPGEQAASRGDVVSHAYILASVHESKVRDWREQYEVITQRMRSEIDQQRAEAAKWSDFSKEVQAERDQLAARVKELEGERDGLARKLTDSAKLARARNDDANSYMAKATEVERQLRELQRQQEEEHRKRADKLLAELEELTQKQNGGHQ